MVEAPGLNSEFGLCQKIPNSEWVKLSMKQEKKGPGQDAKSEGVRAVGPFSAEPKADAHMKKSRNNAHQLVLEVRWTWRT